MAVPPLTLGRVVAELRINPKALTYFANRIDFGSRYYPEPFSDWEINPSKLSLRAAHLRTAITIDSGRIGVSAAAPIEFDEFRELASAAIQHYQDIIAVDDNIRPVRFGFRPRFVLERSSFSELFPHFRSNTLRHERSWVQIPPYSIRDLGFSAIYYGSEQDGLNLTTGILSEDQAQSFLEGTIDIDGEDLRIQDGCLVVDFDRYVKVFDDEAIERVLNEYDLLEERANTLATSILRGL